VFINRYRAKAQFEKTLDASQGTREYRVLMWTGVGGQGKTTLLAEFERMLNERRDLAGRPSATPP
jgi:signal recognition particle GTPase